MLAFIDESGQPHPHDASEFSTLVAVCMDETEHRNLSRRLHAIKREVIGNERLELKALNLMNTRTQVREPRKWELTERAFQFLSELNVIVFAIVMPRPAQVPNIPQDHLPNEHIFLLQRINALTAAQKTTGARHL